MVGLFLVEYTCLHDIMSQTKRNLVKRMETLTHHTNQTFEEMNRAALNWLAGRDPHDIAQKAGICYDAEHQTFSFSSMGTDLTVSYHVGLFVEKLQRLIDCFD